MIKIKDTNGNIVSYKAIKGRDGKSAYEYAVEAGFEGTEQEFINLLIASNDEIYDHMLDIEAHPYIRELIARVSDKCDTKPTYEYLKNAILNHDYYNMAHLDIRELLAVLREEFDALPNAIQLVESHNISNTAHADIRELLGNSIDRLDKLPDAVNLVSTHNESNTAHADIRELVDDIITRLNALADSDDIDLDQLSELVAYIKSNRNLIDSITTSKANKSDIVDNLTTESPNKMLSANMGVKLKQDVDSKSDLNHTHNYAGSKTPGGSANSAVKLDSTSVGNANQPVYFADGKPIACDFSSESQVPPNAIFTDDKVSQENTTDNKDYRVLLSGTDDDNNHIEAAKKNNDLKYNPSTGTLTVKAIAMANATITNDTNKGAIVFRFS